MSTLTKTRSNVFAGSLWMLGITLALFFLPAINGFLGGFVGGSKVGSVSRAMVAAVMPAVLSSGALWVLLAHYDLPVLGALAGTALAMVIAAGSVAIFLGAFIGGLTSSRT